MAVLSHLVTHLSDHSWLMSCVLLGVDEDFARSTQAPQLEGNPCQGLHLHLDACLQLSAHQHAWGQGVKLVLLSLLLCRFPFSH